MKEKASVGCDQAPLGEVGPWSGIGDWMNPAAQFGSGVGEVEVEEGVRAPALCAAAGLLGLVLWPVAEDAEGIVPVERGEGAVTHFECRERACLKAVVIVKEQNVLGALLEGGLDSPVVAAGAAQVAFKAHRPYVACELDCCARPDSPGRTVVHHDSALSPGGETRFQGFSQELPTVSVGDRNDRDVHRSFARYGGVCSDDTG